MIIKTQTLSLHHSFGLGRKKRPVFLYGPRFIDENIQAKKSPSSIDHPSSSEKKAYSESSLTAPNRIYFRQL